MPQNSPLSTHGLNTESKPVRFLETDLAAVSPMYKFLPLHAYSNGAVMGSLDVRPSVRL